jgi:hypothetical protein
MTRVLRSAFIAVLASLALAGTAQAAGGNYVIEGGSPEAQATVRAALDASWFDFSRVSNEITIKILRCGCAGAKPGLIVLDEDVVTNTSLSEKYAWGLIQHEFAHQVDFFLFQQADRTAIRSVLGGKDWCYELRGLAHDDHGCERFAEVFAWAFWPTRHNIQRLDARDLAPRMKARRFRALVNRLLAS